jgi:hypothetical protein
MTADPTAPDLDRIAQRVADGPGFDVSPGAIAARPDPELDRLLDELDDGAVAPLAQRLDDEPDPFLAYIWLQALRRIGTPGARAALRDYAGRLEREDPWAGSFPGAAELLNVIP